MKRLPLFVLLMLSFLSTRANNVQVANAGFEGVPEETTYEVSFDISWENSWRTSVHESNHDAAWVFVKWRSTDHPQWQHCMIESINATPVGCEIILPSDNVGVFIQRNGDGIGDVSFENVSLDWVHPGFGENEIVEICVFAIEMVFVPEGSFQAGDGAEYNFTFQTSDGDGPFTIASENPLTLGGISSENLSSYTDDAVNCQGFFEDDFNTNDTQILPANYPKGYQAFYIMKYEISQGQYAEFLNKLSHEDAAAAYMEQYGVIGQSIKKIGEPSTYRADVPDRAATYIEASEFLRYASWTGLRPMSELEYEKACRGPLPAVPGEYAWGTDELYTEPFTMSVVMDGMEYVIDPGSNTGNCNHNSELFRMIPVGAFAVSSETLSRKESGSSYYGVLDLTGNAFEYVIGLSKPETRDFDGSEHGDGTGDLPLGTTWPVNDLGLRGGAFWGSQAFLRVSNRCYIESYGAGGFQAYSGRLVRSDF